MSDVVRIRDRARFSGPSVGSTIVERTRLDDHFNSAPGQVVRVLAPAGYGKSTLVARWVARDARSVCWLDLESTEDDPLVHIYRCERTGSAAEDLWIPERVWERVRLIAAGYELRLLPLLAHWASKR